MTNPQTASGRALDEPPFGHHIKGNPREGDWYCTCGYGDKDDDFDTAEQHIASLVLDALEAAVRGMDGVTSTTYGANGVGTVLSAHKVSRAAVLEAIQQQRSKP